MYWLTPLSLGWCDQIVFVRSFDKSGMYGERDTITFSKSLEAAFLVLPWHRSESGGWLGFRVRKYAFHRAAGSPQPARRRSLTALLPRSLLRWMSYFGEIYVLSIQKYEEAIYWGTCEPTRNRCYQQKSTTELATEGSAVEGTGQRCG